MSSRDTLPFLRRAAAYGTLLTGLMVSQCVCQNNRPDAPAPGGAETAPSPGGPAADAGAAPRRAAIALPAALDTRDLDADERQVLHDVLSEQYDPCGKPKSFLESLEDPETCPLAGQLGALAVTKVSQGLSKRQIARALLEEQARRANRATFDLAATPVWGDPAKARHVVVEFFDFECPYCKIASERVRALAKQHGAALYAKMLPLTKIHKQAMPAALAARAAHRQGQFWAVYEALFARQEELHAAPAGSSLVRDIVRTVSAIDQERFDRDLADPALKTEIAADVAESEKAQVDGTPTFFVDGMMVEYDALEQALKAAP